MQENKKAKLTFRSHAEEDILLRVKWLNNQEISSFIINEPNYHTDIEQQTAWFAKYKKDQTRKFFTILADNKPIGLVGLSNITQGSADLFIMIGEREYRGLGIGKKAAQFIVNYAFKDLLLSKLSLEVNKNNIIAINLYKALGFVEIGMTTDGTEIRMESKKAGDSVE